MMKGKIRLGQHYISCTDYCNVSACVRQSKWIVTILQIPTTTPTFCTWNTRCPTVLFGGKPPSAVSLYTLL